MHDKLQRLITKLNEDSQKFPENDYRSQVELLQDFSVEFDKILKQTVTKLNGHAEFCDLQSCVKLAFQYVD